jgi:Zn-dependent peptidase ImmA (M78 family)/transcriptional regulator with XRE-family HTH domain
MRLKNQHNDASGQEEQPRERKVPPVNPEMLVLARESRGLTQQEVADLLQIPQSRLSRIEDGFAEVTDDLRGGLEKVLRYPIIFYEQHRLIEGARPTFYRKYSSLSKSVLRQAVARMNVAKIHLEKLLAASEPLDACLPVIDPYEIKGGPAGAAQLVRRLWRIPDGPIKNLTAWVEKAGCLIYEFDFKTGKIDGCGDLIGDVPVIFLNKSTSAVRARFTLAHEIAHLVMHRFPSDNAELEAHEFAAELLMPGSDIKSMFLPMSLDRLARLKLHWRVSMQALLKRAEQLRVLSERNVRHYWMLMSKAGYRTAEPYDDQIPKERPRLLHDLVAMHLNDLRTSVAGIKQFPFPLSGRV